MALRCADSFRETAESFILGKFRNLPKGNLDASTLGDIAACATNLALALEIYLKCLRIQVGLAPRAGGDGHDLWRLYKELPSHIRKDIEARYESGRTRPYPTHASITFALQRNPVAPTWTDGDEKSMKLGEVLKRSKDTFISWRYVFEIRKPEQEGLGKKQTFEYLLLFLACVAIDAVISRNWFTPRLGTDPTAPRASMLLNDMDFAKVSLDIAWKIADVTDQYTGKRYRILNNGVDAIAEEL